MNILIALVCLAGSYLIGAIPFGLLFSKGSGIDIRTQGSKNIGATNVARLLGKKVGAMTLVCDMLKGFVPMFITALVIEPSSGRDLIIALCGAASVLGHMFPMYLGFKGGKGVATFLGTLLALAWPVGLAACATWAVAAAIGRISSLSALIAAALSPVWLLVFGRGQMLVLVVILAVLVFWRHSANIARLMAGTEPRIGQKKA